MMKNTILKIFMLHFSHICPPLKRSSWGLLTFVFFFRFCGDVGVVLWFSVFLLSFFLFLFLVSLRRSGEDGGTAVAAAAVVVTHGNVYGRKKKRITAQMEHSPFL
jgi:hypothetical protein